MERRRSNGSGLAKFIRYESWAAVARTGVSVSAARKAMHSSSAQARSAQRLAIFVKICMAVAPIALARGGASRVPPAIETCAPSKPPFAVRLVTRLAGGLRRLGIVLVTGKAHAHRATPGHAHRHHYRSPRSQLAGS